MDRTTSRAYAALAAYAITIPFSDICIRKRATCTACLENASFSLAVKCEISSYDWVYTSFSDIPILQFPLSILLMDIILLTIIPCSFAIFFRSLRNCVSSTDALAHEHD